MYYATQKNRSFVISFLNIHFIAGEEEMSKVVETAQNPLSSLGHNLIY